MVEAHSQVYGLGWSVGGGAGRDNATGGEEQDCTEGRRGVGGRDARKDDAVDVQEVYDRDERGGLRRR